VNFKSKKFAGYGVDELVYHNYFGDKWKGFFIECGAGSGDSCIFWDKQFHWNGLYLEASPTMYEKIADWRNSYNIGLGKYRTTKTFTDVISAPGGGADNGSFQHTPAHMELLKEYGCTFKKFQIQVIPYRDLIKHFDIKHVDLFVLDVEGYELEVMKGMKGAKLPDVLVVEYPIVGLENVVHMATKKPLSYRFDFVSGNNVYFSRGYAKKEW
jgi:FkbM family methyltransferase